MKFIDRLQTHFVLSYLVQAERLLFFLKNKDLATLAVVSVIVYCWSAGVSEIIGKCYSRFSLGVRTNSIWYPCVMSSVSESFNIVHNHCPQLM